MDDQFLRYYNDELQYLRELGAEFAVEHPKIAGRLGMNNLEVADPYVERLLESFAFLTARVRLKQDAQFPRFTRYLLSSVYPNFLSQMPSMSIAQLNPDLSDPALNEGAVVPRGSRMLSLLGRNEQTRVEFESAHKVVMWPLAVSSAAYLPNAARLSNAQVTPKTSERAGISIQLDLAGGQQFCELPLNALTFYLSGIGELPTQLYEQIVGRTVRVLARSLGAQAEWKEVGGANCICQVGFSEDEALLPTGDPTFSGYRLLQEYFAYPKRFSFFELQFREALAQFQSASIEIMLVMDEGQDVLIDVVNEDNFKLNCTPIINLFKRRSDRVQIGNRSTDHHVVVDKTRPMDFEVWSVDSVKGIGSTSDSEQEFVPLFAGPQQGLTSNDRGVGNFVTSREPRRLSTQQARTRARTEYLGSEVYVSVVDSSAEPIVANYKQLEISVRCTNRDLPMRMALGQSTTDFDLQDGGAVESIRCIEEVSRPRVSYAEGDATWRLISLLSVNYLSLVEGDSSTLVFKDLLQSFSHQADPEKLQQLDGIVGIQTKPIVSRLPSEGPQAFVRGLDIEMTLDESCFSGEGIFVFGAVIDRFFARYVTLNSFTRTRINSTSRQQVMSWPVRIGGRSLA